MRDIWVYVRSVSKFWGALVTGGVAIGALGIWQGLGHGVVHWIFWLIVGIGIEVASFKTWQEVRAALLKAERELEQSGEAVRLSEKKIVEKRSIENSAKWQELADRFARSSQSIRADWQGSKLSETWRLAPSDKGLEALCEVAGAMLLKSPVLRSELLPNWSNAMSIRDTWLNAIRTTGRMDYSHGFYGKEELPDGTTNITTTASIQQLSEASSTLCIRCSARVFDKGSVMAERVQRRIMHKSVILVSLGSLRVLMLAPLSAQTATPYQHPPAAIEQLLDAPAVPNVSVSPSRTTLLIEQPAPFPTIAEVAAPRLRLADLRFNPLLAGPSAVTYTVGLRLQKIAPGSSVAITGLPAKLAALYPTWSPDSRHIAFLERADATPTAKPGLQLWVIDTATARARRLGTVHVNAVLGRPCAWLPDSSGLLCKLVPAVRPAPPVVSDIPTGPTISENLGKATPAPTYEDMLKTPSDETQFEYYATSELAVVPLTGVTHVLPVKGLINSAAPSPDGRFGLVQLLHRPFSYTVPAEAFPLQSEIVPLAAGAGAAEVLNDRPLVDNLPISRDAVEPGPRDYQWRADAPATIVWFEAANGGKPDPKAPIADSVKSLSAPFTGTPITILEAPMRLAGGGPGGRPITWGNAHLALATVSRFSDRKTAMLLFDPTTPGKPTVLYQGSSQDRYHAPGRPVTQFNPQGEPVLKLTPDGKALYFLSPGASPTGDHPTLATVPLTGGAPRPLFRSTDPFYSEPVALLSDTQLLVRRESQTENPNYYLATLTGSADAPSLTKITDFASPYAGIPMPTHQLLHYKRADGVDLTATLWLPAGYDKSQGPLPTLMEAYPAEFKTRAAASQVSGSANRFPTFGWGGSAVYFTQTGYAVLENAAIPIIGEGDQQPNDTYTQQLVDGAKAAIDAGVATGAVDRSRVGVMGHSYGAFMTANLLAHTSLFRAGIARSGAYNRTLTPYGFQNEERTYWQDAKVYYDMSPFSFADKIKTPILLIHGEADDNTGTYPIQSERFYAALKGQGATVRLVFLPLEPHHYGAHESLQHMLWEMNRWLDTYVKPTTPVTTTATGN